MRQNEIKDTEQYLTLESLIEACKVKNLREKEIEISSSENVWQTKEGAGKEMSHFQFRGIFSSNSIHSAGK